MLTNDQINYLFDFCRKHYVQYYDVQVELVDHLANAIEDKMALDKKATFETALNHVYAGFGFTGFSKVVGAKTRAMEKAARRIRKKLFFSYFTIPRVAMTICLFIGLSMLPSFMPREYLGYVFVTILIGLLLMELRISLIIRRLHKKQEKILLLTKTGTVPPFFTVGLFVSSNNVVRLFKNEEISVFSGTIIYEVFVLFVILMLVCILAWKEHVHATESLARQQYPQAFAG